MNRPLAIPNRGFPVEEFRARLAAAQQAMGTAGIDALLLTTHPDFYYFTGFLTRFWESPTRPWFLILPQTGEPVAVIPGIGATLMESTWIDDIRTWVSPDLVDDGIGLLAETLMEIVGGGRIGLPDGPETHLRMPLGDFNRLMERCTGLSFGGDTGIVRDLRMLKSEAEIAKIEHACAIAGAAFDRVGEVPQPGMSLDAVFRRFQMLCLEEGADYVPYLAGGAGPDGYADVISPASTEPLTSGDVLMLDTGLAWDGYFCDFDRNFALGHAPAHLGEAHSRLIESTVAGFDAAKPGATTREIFTAMETVLIRNGGSNPNSRLGHGLGIQLTEWPSLIAADETELKPGMVLTLEPGVETANGCLLVHEEDIVITDTGVRWLTRPAGASMPVIGQRDA